MTWWWSSGFQGYPLNVQVPKPHWRHVGPPALTSSRIRWKLLPMKDRIDWTAAIAAGGVLPPFWKIPCHSVFSQPAKIKLTSGSCHFFQQQQMGWLHRLISKWDPADILPCISTAFLLNVGFTCARSPVCVWILFSGWNASRLRRRCVTNSSGALL